MRLTPETRRAVIGTLRSRGLIDVTSVMGDALTKALETAVLHGYVEALLVVADQLDAGTIATIDPVELAKGLRASADALLAA